jgi:enoyl-CoA hydratase
MTFETIICETRGPVGVITFNRPKALNALNAQLIHEMNVALDQFDADPAVDAIVLTGSEKAFAAGADIREMKDFTAETARGQDFLKTWDHINSIRKPIIAAVSGYCLGGGFEYALIADILIAGDTAKFALPEITLGIFPGLGGTQRLARIVVGADQVMSVAVAMAEKISAMSHPAVAAAKRMVNTAFEHGLDHGLHLERAAFYACFDFADQKEGMAAFLEKRKAVFVNK